MTNAAQNQENNLFSLSEYITAAENINSLNHEEDTIKYTPLHHTT